MRKSKALQKKEAAWDECHWLAGEATRAEQYLAAHPGDAWAIKWHKSAKANARAAHRLAFGNEDYVFWIRD